MDVKVMETGLRTIYILILEGRDEIEAIIAETPMEALSEGYKRHRSEKFKIAQLVTMLTKAELAELEDDKDLIVMTPKHKDKPVNDDMDDEYKPESDGSFVDYERRD